MHDGHPRSRLVAKVVREVLATGSFPSLADLTGAVKDRLGRLKIQASADDLNAAYRAIESNTPLLPEPPAAPSRREQAPVNPFGDRLEAAAFCRALRMRVRAMPAGETARAVDRRKAAQLIAQEMLASIARCEALEAEDPYGD